MKDNNSEIKLFTSESVTEGHPDKLCDYIADSILDTALGADPMSRIACEVCATTGLVMVMGEFTTNGYIDIPKVVRDAVKEVGYDNAAMGFDYKTCAVISSIDEQSPDIAMGVDSAIEKREGASCDAAEGLGAGDQGMMFGYACNETPDYMPMPIYLAHKLTKRLSEVRKNGEVDFLRPDGKAQVTVAYEGGKVSYVDTVVVSTQHDESASLEEIKKTVMEKVIRQVIDEKLLTTKTKYYINPTGRFVIGGPNGDTGVTGRKIIVDTYGGYCPHGGGAFSGKDPTKVDRSACYYARYVCKNIVAAGIADKCEIEVAYAIGKAHPVSLYINTFGTSKFSQDEIASAVEKIFDFRPYSIIENLGLRKPIYKMTTNYGHFGKKNLPWEKTDKADALRSALGLKK